MDEIIRRLRRFSFEKLFRVVRTTLNKEKNIPGRERQETIDNFHKLFFQDRCDLRRAPSDRVRDPMERRERPVSPKGARNRKISSRKIRIIEIDTYRDSLRDVL